jgi:large subunit ribosomal protein L20
MARVKRGVRIRARHKKIIKMASGYRGRSKNCYRIALQRVEKALQYAYRDRRNRKRDMRALWIQRINAACRCDGLKYSQFINAISKISISQQSGIILNRRILSDLAVHEPEAFSELVKSAKSVLSLAA